MSFLVHSYGATDTGLVRQNNEDYWARLPKHEFYILADGMGGHQAGEVASQEAVSGLASRFEKLLTEHKGKPITPALLREKLAAYIEEVNGVVYKMGCENPRLKGMGTTLCCVYLYDETLLFANVGDSRIYRMRKQKLEQLTRDDSLFRELVDMGELSEQDAEDFLYKNIITKAIGLTPQVDPSVHETSLSPGDIILLCSDGLTDMLSFDEMAKIIQQSLFAKKLSVEETTRLLVAAAKERGGVDNITVVLLQVQGADEAKNLSR